MRHQAATLLPAVLPPVTRHALLRLPGIALALAFLGLGADRDGNPARPCPNPNSSLVQRNR